MAIAFYKAIMQLKSREFESFRSLVYETSGINLGEGKESLVSSRIGKRMRILGMEDFQSYLDCLKDGSAGDEMVHMLDAISTNVTSFFREPEHFDFIREKAGEWVRAGQKRFRFWSAASSSGEEPYTLAMTLSECGLTSATDTRILATDLSTRILAAAREGVYASAKLASLPSGYASRYFAPAGGGTMAVRDSLRDMVAFSRLNLAFPPFPMKGPLDIILVRNVMIYFDNDVRKKLIDDCHRLLKPGGYLLVGHAESLTGLVTGFKCVKPSVYLKQAQ
ncbi:MAG: methyltransferase, CheR-type [Fibrobacteres bacterium]|nr:methyltransferase, CheR-type [Fibrobacterota bacterium]